MELAHSPKTELDTLIGAQTEILKSVPWTLDRCNGSLFVSQDKVSTEARELLDAIARAGSNDCPVAFYCSDNRGGGTEKPRYSLDAPKYKDDPQQGLWQILYKPATERFEQEMKEICSLPWIPSPKGLSGIALDGPFIIPANNLSEAQRQIAEKYLGTKIYLNEDSAFWTNHYVYMGSTSRSRDWQKVRGGDLIQKSIEERRTNFNEVLSQLPWKLDESAKLVLNTKDALKILAGLLPNSADSNGSAALAIREQMLGKQGSDSRLTISFSQSDGTYWDPGDMLGGNDAYIFIIKNILSKEKEFLSRFTDPKYHSDPIQRTKLFEEAASFGFCTPSGHTAFKLTDKLLTTRLNYDLPKELRVDLSSTYEGAVRAILSQPKLFGLKVSEIASTEQAKNWSLEYESVENKRAQKSFSCNDWETVGAYYQIVDLIESRNKQAAEAAEVNKQSYKDLPWQLIFPPNSRSSEEFQLLLPDHRVVTGEQEEFAGNLVRHLYLPARCLPHYLANISEEISRDLRGEVKILLDQLHEFPFVEGEQYDSWQVSWDDLEPANIELFERLLQITNLISKDDVNQTYIVYENIRDTSTNQNGQLPEYHYSENFAQNYIRRCGVAEIEIPESILALPWSYGSYMNLVMSAKALGADADKLPLPPFKTSNGFDGPHYGKVFELSVPGKYSLNKDPALMAVHNAWAQALKSIADQRLDDGLRKVADLPWKPSECGKFWTIDSIDLTKEQAGLLNTIPNAAVNFENIEFSSTYSYFMPARYYQQMTARFALTDASI